MTTEDTDTIKKALDILVVLNTAVKNVRLYPPASATIINTLEKLYQACLDALSHEDPLIFAESEKNLLVCGTLLNQKDQDKPHVAAILGLMTAVGVKSISLGKGLEKEELSSFVNLMSLKPEIIAGRGGLSKLLPEHNISHIALDQKIYVAMDKNRQILSSLDITDDQIAKFLIMSRPDMDPHSPQLQEMAKDPKTLAKAFETGLSQMMAQKGKLTDMQMSENVNRMLWLVDNLSNNLDSANRDILSQNVGQALITADSSMAKYLSTQNVEHLLGGLLLKYLTDELTESPSMPGAPGCGGENRQQEALPAGAQSAKAKTSAPATGENKVMQVAKKYILHIQDDKTLMDKSLMSVLSKIVEELIAQKEKETMITLIERLAANLNSPSSEIRISAAGGLADILDRLEGDLLTETINLISIRLTVWVKVETVYSPEYLRICTILKNLTQNYIAKKQYPKATSYLDAFNAGIDGTVEKTDAMKDVSVDMIDQLASSANMQALLDETASPDAKVHEDAVALFAALGSIAVTKLLDQLHDTTDSDERVNIMHLLMAVKDKSLPLIVGQIKKHEPWYYLRNLAYMTGQIGNEEHARFLAPLLQHENIRLRQEALKSIYRIGGNFRGKMLTAALPEADEEFKISIVETLGQCKAQDAVLPLLDLLKERPLIASAVRQNLEEKICSALGAIGSPDAIGPLSEIAETKSFLGLRSYPDKVKAAAARALVTLRRMVAESGTETDIIP